MDIHSVSSGECPTVANRWMYYTLALMPWLSRDSKSLKACVNLKNIISHHFFFLTHQTDFRQSSKPSVSHKCGHSLFCSLMLADAGKDWRQKKVTEDEMVGWHHQLSGHELGQTLGDGEWQGSLACCSSWGGKELNNNAVGCLTTTLRWADQSELGPHTGATSILERALAIGWDGPHLKFWLFHLWAGRFG